MIKSLDFFEQNQNVADSLERAIIGSLEGKKVQILVFSLLSEKYFLNKKNRELYSLIKKEVFVNSNDIISVVVKGKMSSLWVKCQETQLSMTHEIKNAIKNLKDVYAKNEIEKMVASLSLEEIQDFRKTSSDMVQKIIEITYDSDDEKATSHDIGNEYEKAQQEFLDKRAEGKNLIGLETGFKKIDSLIDGLRPGHFWVIGGYTSSGKTYIALNITNALIQQNIPVTFYSLEMTKVDIFGRLLAMRTGVQSSAILKGFVRAEDAQKVKDAIQSLKNEQLKVYETRSQLSEIVMSMRAEILTRNVECFVIDYGQLIQSEKDNEYDTMRKAATELQAFAKKHSVPIIMLSQISNESARNQETDMIGFKGSGALGASADLAIEIRSGETDRLERLRKMKEGIPVNVIASVKKNRHGRTGEVVLKFHSNIGRFEEENDLDDITNNQ